MFLHDPFAHHRNHAYEFQVLLKKKKKKKRRKKTWNRKTVWFPSLFQLHSQALEFPTTNNQGSRPVWLRSAEVWKRTSSVNDFAPFFLFFFFFLLLLKKDFLSPPPPTPPTAPSPTPLYNLTGWLGVKHQVTTTPTPPPPPPTHTHTHTNTHTRTHLPPSAHWAFKLVESRALKVDIITDWKRLSDDQAKAPTLENFERRIATASSNSRARTPLPSHLYLKLGSAMYKIKKSHSLSRHLCNLGMRNAGGERENSKTLILKGEREQKLHLERRDSRWI